MQQEVKNSPSSFFILLEVDWTEPWFIALVAFHACVTVTTICTRNNGNIQGALFLILLALVYSSEALNEMAARNWRLFSKYQYFDSNGLFISTIFSVPLLLNCIVMVGTWMWSSGNLMIDLKKKQLKRSLLENSTPSQKQDTIKSRKRYSSASKAD